MEMEQLALTTDEWNIGSGDPMKDILGKGLIVHQGTDDFTLNHQVMLVLGSFIHHKINRLQKKIALAIIEYFSKK
jgi:hypothetical protein